MSSTSRDSSGELKLLLQRANSELERKLLFLGWLSRELKALGAPAPIVVGGTSVEIYTGGIYTSGDIDLVYPFRDMLEEVLRGTGLFRREGRFFISDELEIFLEVVDSRLWGDESRAIVLDLGGGLELRVIGIEDIIIDRLSACKHWNSRVDCELAEILLRKYRNQVDWTYLQRRASEEEVDELLRELSPDWDDGDEREGR